MKIIFPSFLKMTQVQQEICSLLLNLLGLHGIIRDGQVDLIDFALHRNFITLEQRCVDGYTPLACAAIENRPDIAEYLIDRGANMEAQDNDGNTPMLLAIKYGNIEVIKILVKHGANLYGSDKYGNSYMTVAQSRDNAEIIEYLMPFYSPGG